ncbi:hypothetical protein SDC9_170105 [bioreactor metagenome]|uniref:Uncharacterized protein n=1 Tax=bioreactor metagenome TaxID=1076179 RepID=A0A645G9R7_9ZZZZ
MGDHNDGHAQLFLEFLHQLEYLRLNGHIQGCGWFISDEDIRFTGQRHGNHHALTHAAGELVRVLLQALMRLIDADQLQHLKRAVSGLLPVAVGVKPDSLRQLVFHRVDGVQACHRVLENDRNLRAANLAHLLGRHLDNVLVLEHNAALGDAAGVIEDAQDGVGCYRLAGARLAHQPQHLAAIQIKADAVDGLYFTRFSGKNSMQVLYLQQRFRHIISSAWDQRHRAAHRPEG